MKNFGSGFGLWNIKGSFTNLGLLYFNNVDYCIFNKSIINNQGTIFMYNNSLGISTDKHFTNHKNGEIIILNSYLPLQIDSLFTTYMNYVFPTNPYFFPTKKYATLISRNPFLLMITFSNCSNIFLSPSSVKRQ